MRRLVPLALVLLLPACQFKRQEAPAIYAPWEEGRTLGYENPSLPGAEQQRESRIQVRVAEGVMDPLKPGLIRLTRSSLQAPPVKDFLRVDERGVERLGEDGQRMAWVLPKGFPDRVSRWKDDQGRVEFRVLGPGAWENPAHVKGLFDPIGVWVEATGPGGRQRALMLRGLGEVEVLEWRQERWVCISRLVDMGMTDDRSSGK